MSHVHRLRSADRIFFVTVNLRRVLAPLGEEELGLVVEPRAQGVGSEAGGLALVEL